MVYGIFSGEYSDWDVEGYFDNKEDAEKYVAFENNKLGYDEYRIIELSNMKIDEKIKNTKVKYYYSVLFTYKKQKFIMQNTPNNYKITLEDIPRQVRCGYSWIRFNLIADTREQAEKICQDLMAKIFYDFQETGDIKESIKNVCVKWEIF
jgi:hypothetical protein|nr:MAG TPA: hypothetical protein [Caudoviricetes sp.]